MIGEFKALSVGTSYTFATGDLLDQPNTYFYSAFVGVDFITAWIDSRNACLKYCKQSSKNYFNINLLTQFNKIAERLINGVLPKIQTKE